MANITSYATMRNTAIASLHGQVAGNRGLRGGKAPYKMPVCLEKFFDRQRRILLPPFLKKKFKMSQKNDATRIILAKSVRKKR